MRSYLLSIYLAFAPSDIRHLAQTPFETFLINDSEYLLHYAYLSLQAEGWRLRAAGMAKPGAKVWLEDLPHDVLTQLSEVCLQTAAYKRGEPFEQKPMTDARWAIDPAQFRKLKALSDHPFLQQPAIVFTAIEHDRVPQPLTIDAEQLRRQMMTPATPSPTLSAASPKRAAKGEPQVIDLHAEALLETTTGMTPADILDYQLDVFRRTLKSFEGKRGTRLIFIHGKGDGVLRHALITELQYRYKNYTHEDASFQKYGFGATQVTIR